MRTVIIDGNNTLWRIAKQLPILTAPSGNRVEVIYGFLRIVRSSLEMFEPDSALVAWDEGESKIRIGVYDGYKYLRRQAKLKFKTKDEERAFLGVMYQMAAIKRTLSYLCVAQMWIRDTEGDDIISNAAYCLPGRKIIVSADHDMLQLVDKETSVYFPLTRKPEHFKFDSFEKKVGLTPRQFVEVKALAGDSGDEIPGVAKGFGEGAARDLVLKYGSVEKMWSNRDEIRKTMSKRHALICGHEIKALYYRNLKLVDLSLTHSKTLGRMIKEELRTHRRLDKTRVLSYFKDQNFASLLKDFARWLKPFERLRERNN